MWLKLMSSALIISMSVPFSPGDVMERTLGMEAQRTNDRSKRSDRKLKSLHNCVLAKFDDDSSENHSVDTDVLTHATKITEKVKSHLLPAMRHKPRLILCFLGYHQVKY